MFLKTIAGVIAGYAALFLALCWQNNVSIPAAAFVEAGTLLRGAGQHDIAIKAFSSALAYVPQAPKVYGARAYSFYKSGRFDDAAADYDRALNIEGLSAMRLSQHASAYFGAQKYDFAVRDYAQALTLDPENIDHLYRRGLARVELNDLNPAIADFSAVIKRDPNRADFYRSRAHARKLSGDSTGMEEDTSRALINECMQGWTTDCDTPEIQQAVANIERADKSHGGSD
jgi:tetratricopeptide (TPR) repeat protein